jgi:hypothetical protein
VGQAILPAAAFQAASSTGDALLSLAARNATGARRKVESRAMLYRDTKQLADCQSAAG